MEEGEEDNEEGNEEAAGTSSARAPIDDDSIHVFEGHTGEVR